MEQIEYTRTVVPSSMRSPYWKYFGFPSDNSNNILTRQKIVCTICNTAIAYNKNTSNLRTHLMSKHVEIFKKIITPSKSKLETKHGTFCNNTDEKINSDVVSYPTSDCVIKLHDVDTKRHCFGINDEATASLQRNNRMVENCFSLHDYESENSINQGNNANKIDLETQNPDCIAYLPSTDITQLTETAVEAYSTNNLDYERGEKAFMYTYVDHIDNQKQEQQSLDIILADLIQTDLLPLETLEENGICKYNQQLTGQKIDADTIERVKAIIERRFTNMQHTITANLYRLSRSQPFSLSFEIYEDNEGQDVLNIYFNYINDKQMNLESVLYTSNTVCTKALNISKLLEEINLKNCNGVVVKCLDNVIEFISDFTKFYELPLIECLESLLTRSLQKIFDETEFLADYRTFLKTILENKKDISLKKSNFRQRSNWSTLNYLEYIFQEVAQNELDQWSEFRRAFEYLKPLKMALDIITDEPLPLCSLSRPLVKKLFEEHFSFINCEESRIIAIQKILRTELYERIMTQNFLNEVTYFDTRFHRDFALEDPLSDINKLKTQIVKRFKHILQINYTKKTNDDEVVQNSPGSFMNNLKCNSLKSFFKRDGSLTNTNVTPDFKTNLDIEFEQYHIQAFLDLDQSPVLWWQQQSHKYEQLSKIARNYLSIPCCCLPRLCRIDSEQRYSKLDRRKNLSQFCNIESKLWYLYYNIDVAEL